MLTNQPVSYICVLNVKSLVGVGAFDQEKARVKTLPMDGSVATLLKIIMAVIYYCFPKNPNIKNENYEKKRR